jgi:broad specificity phosphatase PhoE
MGEPCEGRWEGALGEKLEDRGSKWVRYILVAGWNGPWPRRETLSRVHHRSCAAREGRMFAVPPVHASTHAFIHVHMITVLSRPCAF